MLEFEGHYTDLVQPVTSSTSAAGHCFLLLFLKVSTFTSKVGWRIGTRTGTYHIFALLGAVGCSCFSLTLIMLAAIDFILRLVSISIPPSHVLSGAPVCSFVHNTTFLVSYN